jgi:HEAT repeat protein
VHGRGARLVERVGQAAIDTLMQARKHASAAVRYAAVRALSRLDTPEIAAVLFEQLEVENDPDVRRALVLHEGYGMVDGAVELLVDLMLHDADAWLRMQAAFRMELFAARAVPPLLEALRDPPVTRAAAMSLGRIGDLRALPGLADAWRDPANESCSQEIARALADVAIRAAHDAPPAAPPDLADRVRALVSAWEPAGWVGQACKELGALALHGNAIHGIGLRMLRAVLDDLRARGVERAVVGTGNAGIGQLAFYQRAGFRLLRIERDFFTPARGYPAWMEEGGIRLLDMVWMDVALGGR